VPAWLSDALWATSVLAALYVVGRALVTRDFLRYPILTIYVAAQASMDVSSVFVLRHYGLRSEQYAFHYYYLGSLLTVVLFFVVIELFQQVFDQLGVRKEIRVGSILLVAASAALAYAMVERNAGRLTTRFVVEFSQNLYFAGVVLTYLLWIAVLRLRETRARLVQLVLALGISFTAVTAAFALTSLFPGEAARAVRAFVQPAAGTFLPLSWAYTFTRVPEESQVRMQAIALGTPLPAPSSAAQR
jgi:hypothetical protein